MHATNSPSEGRGGFRHEGRKAKSGTFRFSRIRWNMHFRRGQSALASRGLVNSTNFGRKSSGGSTDTCPWSGGPTLFGNRNGIELGGERLELFAGKRPEER